MNIYIYLSCEISTCVMIDHNSHRIFAMNFIHFYRNSTERIKSKIVLHVFKDFVKPFIIFFYFSCCLGH